MAKSMDIQMLQSKYPTRHFDEIQLPSGITHYQSIGTGPVIILVHGVSGPLAVWDKTIDALVAAGIRDPPSTKCLGTCFNRAGWFSNYGATYREASRCSDDR